jgi:hypothetical protein
VVHYRGNWDFSEHDVGEEGRRRQTQSDHCDMNDLTRQRMGRNAYRKIGSDIRRVE